MSNKIVMLDNNSKCKRNIRIYTSVAGRRADPQHSREIKLRECEHEDSQIVLRVT
jgi:hypothetical protein